jgi:hypothetical protein
MFYTYWLEQRELGGQKIVALPSSTALGLSSTT